MKFSTNKIFFSLNIFLAVLASYMVGSFIGIWSHYQSNPEDGSLSGSNDFSYQNLPKDPGKTQKSFDIILERNIFNAQKKEVDNSETSLEEKISVVEVIDDIGVKNTSLAIVLSGTMIYGEKNSYAFISKKDSLNKYVIFGVGECFDAIKIQRDKICSNDSVKILEIKDRWILIKFQGEKQALRMVNFESDREVSSISDLKKNEKNQDISDKKKSRSNLKDVKKVLAKRSISKEDFSNDMNTFHFKRVWVDEQLANFEQLLNDARVVPIMKDGKPYFMFQFIKKESIYEKLGLQKKDIILEINGFIVDSVGKALKLLEVLQSEREISLKVEREGNPVKFHYYIN